MIVRGQARTFLLMYRKRSGSMLTIRLLMAESAWVAVCSCSIQPEASTPRSKEYWYPRVSRSQVSEGDFTKIGFNASYHVSGVLWADLLFDQIFTGKNVGAGRSVGFGLSYIY